MKKYIVSLLILLIAAITANATALGSWTAYPAYYDITEIVPAGNDIFVLSSNDLFSYNTKDNSLTTYDKTKNLSDCNISHISWNNSVKKLIIVYDNSNLDIMSVTGSAENLSDLYNKTMTSDKTVNSIMMNGIYAYLSTGFGVVKVNMKSTEISETYNLSLDIKYTVIKDNNIYVLTSNNSIYVASLSSNLIDKGNWNITTDSSLYSIFDTSSKTLVYDSTNKCYWASDSNGKLISKTKNDDGTFTVTSSGVIPDGPKYNYFGKMIYKNSKLYTIGGSWFDYYYSNYPGTIQVLENDNWIIYQDQLDTITGYNYRDVSSIAVDPNDDNHVFVSTCGTGIYEFNNGKYVNNFTSGNSELLSAIKGDNNYVRADGLIYDSNNNLWMLNSSSANALIKYSSDKKWTVYNDSKLFLKTDVSYGHLCGSFIDSNKLLWFCNDNWNGQFVYKFDLSDNTLTSYSNFVNQDGSAISTLQNVRCLIEDMDNNIWVGTDAGLLVLTPAQIKDPTAGFTQIKVPRNDGTNYADYLLSGVSISCIAIDGGNRKWVGTTDNGLYLISSDNMTQIHHFLSDNSKLLSDNITSLAIDGNKGEVYIGTSEGLCSYKSDATATSDDMTKDNVYAYPNPVEPDYTGLISIVGLTYDADVKIVTSNGVLVAEGRSTGGMFTWDGKDIKGKSVASGIYMVETAKSDGSKGTVCKIAIIK